MLPKFSTRQNVLDVLYKERNGNQGGIQTQSNERTRNQRVLSCQEKYALAMENLKFLANTMASQLHLLTDLNNMWLQMKDILLVESITSSTNDNMLLQPMSGHKLMVNMDDGEREVIEDVGEGEGGTERGE